MKDEKISNYTVKWIIITDCKVIGLWHTDQMKKAKGVYMG